MKLLLLTTLVCLISITSSAQPDFETWQMESLSNKRLLPRYGHLPKTEAEINSDSIYIRKMLELPQFKSRREASDHVINLGFQYYYRQDFKTAMYRFNQAYLLDSSNTNIFWGYGAIYMAFGRYDLAKEQYLTGLSIDSANNHLLTDLATYFMEQHFHMSQMPANDLVKDPQKEARRFMDSALNYLVKSYEIDPADVNTTYKLSICYWQIDDCSNAWKFYDLAMALGGRPVTREYTRDLKKRCKRD